MLDRDFAANVVARSRGVAGLVQGTLVEAKGSLAAQAGDDGFTRSAADVIVFIHEVLVDPTLAERPDWMPWLQRGHAEPTWDTFDLKDVVVRSRIRPRPIDALHLARDAALRMLAILETCRWHLQFLIADGRQAEIADLPRIHEAAQAVVGLLFRDFVQPLWQRFPDLERRVAEELLPWPALQRAPSA